MGETRNRHSFRPLLFVPPQGPDALPVTVREPAPPARPARPRDAGDSHVRLRAMPAASIDWLDAQEILDELGEEQLALGVNLACLEQAVAITPREPARKNALAALDRRLSELGAFRDALASVQLAAIDRRVQRIFVADSALSDYLRGLYAWGHAVVRALDQLAMSLRAHRPDWAMLRYRLEEARNFHFDDLDVAIRSDVASLPPIAGRDDLARAVEELFVTAHALEAGTGERFTSAS
jgi:hypothetical protein